MTLTVEKIEWAIIQPEKSGKFWIARGVIQATGNEDYYDGKRGSLSQYDAKSVVPPQVGDVVTVANRYDTNSRRPVTPPLGWQSECYVMFQVK